MDIIKSIEHEQLKARIPDLKIGNTVRVHVRIKEGNKERIQVFEGIIIKVQGSGVNKTFTVRKISYGVGVEKTFLVHSPLVEKVELVRVGKARRAKLFYLRDRIGKAAKTKEIAGARIENKEIIIKGEEVAPQEESPVVEEVKAEVEAPVAEEVKAEVEAPVAEEVKAEVEAPVAEEVKAEAVETAQEVKTEAVEEVKAETPATEEAPAEENKAE
jgi:large subunit ribosomal protein L19